MRCNNCGWDNAPGSSSCVKCGHPIQVENTGYNNAPYQGVNVPNYNQSGEPQPRPTVVVNAQPADAPVPRPTRIVNGPIQQDQQLKATVAQVPKNCPHCGYPVMGDFTSCPNCGASIAPAPTTIQGPDGKPETPAAPMAAPVAAPLAEAAISGTKSVLKEMGIDEIVKCDKCGAEVSIDFTFCPKCGERIHLPTVRAIRHKPTPAPEPPKPKCRLTIVPEEDELEVPAANEYEGASIILTRENTEANNRTITSKEQAELICEDGKWFVLNKSELGSTYLEANRKLEIQQGDIIVLGDRRFKFEVE